MLRPRPATPAVSAAWERWRCHVQVPDARCAGVLATARQCTSTADARCLLIPTTGLDHREKMLHRGAIVFNFSKYLLQQVQFQSEHTRQPLTHEPSYDTPLSSPLFQSWSPASGAHLCYYSCPWRCVPRRSPACAHRHVVAANYRRTGRCTSAALRVSSAVNLLFGCCY